MWRQGYMRMHQHSQKRLNGRKLLHLFTHAINSKKGTPHITKPPAYEYLCLACAYADAMFPTLNCAASKRRNAIIFAENYQIRILSLVISSINMEPHLHGHSSCKLIFCPPKIQSISSAEPSRVGLGLTVMQ